LSKVYYFDVIGLLKAKNYEKSGVEYRKLAIDFLNRQDYKTGSLLFLLHGLSLLKAGNSYELVKEKINDFLKSLKANKEVIKRTFYGLLLLCLINSKLLEREHYFLKIKNLMEILPLLEEEKDLIEI
jgi:hypothetical protein